MEATNGEILIYNTDDGKVDVKLYSKDGVIWMNQQQMALLFDTSKQNISLHIVNVLQDKELDKKSVVKDYLTTASDGKNYNVTYYALPMVLAVGFRVRSIRGTQFRKWANKNLTEFLQKGFVMDDERLKNSDDRPDYFDELLERIRDIRASEKRFYQKVRDLFSLSSDYDATDKATQMFFAATQKMRKDLTMHYWEGNVDKLITDHDLPLLEDKGHCSTKQMESKVEEIYFEYDKRRKAYDV